MLWRFLSFSSISQFQFSLAYIFIYDFTFRWRGLVERLYLFTLYALRWATAFRNLFFTSVLAYHLDLAFTDFPRYIIHHISMKRSHNRTRKYYIFLWDRNLTSFHIFCLKEYKYHFALMKFIFHSLPLKMLLS